MTTSIVLDDNTRHFVRLRELGFTNDQAEGLVEIREQCIAERRALRDALRKMVESVESSFRRPRYLPLVLCGTVMAAAVTLVAQLMAV